MTELSHIGTDTSGRYPKGSGANPNQHHIDFLSAVDKLRKQGLSPVMIAKGMGLETTTQLRANSAIAKNALKKADIAQVQKLKDTGMGASAIGRELHIPETSVRALLDPATKARNDVLMATADQIKEHISKGNYLDIGSGTENWAGVSKDKLKVAVAILEKQGYKIQYLRTPQPGASGNLTTVKVLTPDSVSYSELLKNTDKVRPFTDYSEDLGHTWKSVETPINVSSKRIGVRYAEQGGKAADGVIEVRRGKDDISLGEDNYLQVRIAVDGTHFLKGMAMYSDHIPDGVDMVFNTDKSDTGNKLDAMKKLFKDPEHSDQIDPDLPFSSIIRQRHYTDAAGNEKLSALNIVGTPGGVSGSEGSWDRWNKSLSPQFLSKQSTDLAKEQLGMTFDFKQLEFDQIKALTNPTIKKLLLEKFADSVDSSAVHMKAAALPRQRTRVLLPIRSMKENEIYAPHFNNGEQVSLIRFPHGGIFEIPTLTVNNKNPEAKRLIRNAQDAVGINSKVAVQLSGADFDGDTVLVIPNNSGRVASKSPLEDLKDFDPQRAYPKYDGMPPMRSKQQEMGKISNLITDMTIKGASDAELARAVKHSMVVIDSEKHELNYKLSARQNGINQLVSKYQAKTEPGAQPGGASTLISRAKSKIRVPERKTRLSGLGGPIDPATGQKMYQPTGATYPEYNKKTKLFTGVMKPRETKTTRLAEATDARSLLSTMSTPMERVYADHSNKLKAMANAARKAAYETGDIKHLPSATVAYAPQVSSLKSKLNIALKNAPLERQATLLVNAKVKAKRQSNPNMEPSEIKKLRGTSFVEMRLKTGAGKTKIDFTPSEWEAIQAGAISKTMLNTMLKNADLDKIKELATPRDTTTVPTYALSRARTMLSGGYTQVETAAQLGISVTTLVRALNQ